MTDRAEPSPIAVPDRRRTSDARLDDIAADMAATRADVASLKAFMEAQAVINAAQAVTNTEVRDHITTSRGLGVVHQDQWDDLSSDVTDHAARIRAMEDWRIEMRTLMAILKATFGVSLIGAILALASLAEMIGRIGR